MSAPGAAALEQVKTELVPALLRAFPAGVTELPTPFETPQVLVAPELVLDVARWLKERGFNSLHDVAGVDYLGYPDRTAANRLEVVYHFLALPQLWRLRLRVQLPADKPELPSLADLYQSANPAEREVYDQFGVRFRGHPNLTRVLNPEDWEGHPLRKDYPLRGPRALVPLLDAEDNRFFPIREAPTGE